MMLPDTPWKWGDSAMGVTCTCGTTFEARNPRAKYCSDRCRKQAQRGGKVVVIPEPARTPAGGEVERTTTAALSEAGRLDTPLGAMCVALARRIDGPTMDTGSAVAALAARLSELLDKSMKGTKVANAPQQLQDELAARRAKHGA